MEIQELIQTSYENSKAKGWYDGEVPDFSMRLALILSEMAEALEEHRRGKKPNEIYFAGDPAEGSPFERARRGEKPEGIIIELADVVIRLGDMSGYYGFDLGDGQISTGVHGLDPTRAGVKTFGQWHNLVVKHFLKADGWFLDQGFAHEQERRIQAGNDLAHALSTTLGFVHWLGITGEEFESAIRIKWAYNLTRSYRHGNKVA